MKNSKRSITADDISSFFLMNWKNFSFGNIPTANIYNDVETNFTNNPGRSLIICRRDRRRVETVLNQFSENINVYSLHTFFVYRGVKLAAQPVSFLIEGGIVTYGFDYDSAHRDKCRKNPDINKTDYCRRYPHTVPMVIVPQFFWTQEFYARFKDAVIHTMGVRSHPTWYTLVQKNFYDVKMSGVTPYKKQ